MLTYFEQAVLAMTCYNKTNFESICKSVFPSAIFHQRETDTERFGWLDHGNGVASVWMVGTHGETRLKRIIAWFGNLLASDNDNDGRHDGFEMLAEMINKLIGEYLSVYNTLYFFGHSRACAVLAILAYLLKDKYKSVKISGRVFCPPVAGNRQFAKTFNALIPDWKFYVSEGDLINGKFMRNDKSDMLDGVDVGTSVNLPKSNILQSIPLVSVIAHSPKNVVIPSMKKAKLINDTEMILLKKWCVN